MSWFIGPQDIMQTNHAGPTTGEFMDQIVDEIR